MPSVTTPGINFLKLWQPGVGLYLLGWTCYYARGWLVPSMTTWGVGLDPLCLPEGLTLPAMTIRRADCTRYDYLRGSAIPAMTTNRAEPSMPIRGVGQYSMTTQGVGLNPIWLPKGWASLAHLSPSRQQALPGLALLMYSGFSVWIYSGLVVSTGEVFVE